MQLEALECGAAALAMVMAYYGKWVPLEQVRLDCGVSRDGSRASNMALAARNYGFDVKAYRFNLEGIRENGKFPCIIHWHMNHFVVLNGFKGNYAFLNDPARGVVRIPVDAFEEAFSGVTLILVPSENFEPSGKPKSMIAYARRRLIGAGAAVIFMMLTTAIGYLFGISNSVMTRIFMDRLLTGTNRDWLYPFIIFMICLIAIQLIVAWIQAIYSLKINGKMAVIGSSTYMWKVLHLPMEFFSQRLAGDIQGRLSLNASIAGTLVDTFAPLLLNSAMMIFYFVLMLSQSPLLTLIGIVTLGLNMFVSRKLARRRINTTRVRMRDAGKLEAVTASGIDMIETIKASGAENGYFQKWAGYQASVNRQNFKSARTAQFLGMVPVLLSTLAGHAVMVLGVWMTMQGDFTLGAVMMFQGFLSSFMSPAMTLVSTGQTIQEMRTHMERVEDVMEYPEDIAVVGNAAHAQESGSSTATAAAEPAPAAAHAQESGSSTATAASEHEPTAAAEPTPAAAEPAPGAAAPDLISASAALDTDFSDILGLDKLRGNLELRHITYGYSRLEKPLIEDFSLSLKVGQRVALVGPSGCGKSTISKLVSGLYQPWKGEILFDGKPRSAYPREVMTGSVAVVDQDIILFEDTIANNIKMWDESIKDFEMILAARDAQIHDDITQLSGSYQHRLVSGGRNLSGGQRQRLEIARVLAQDPTLLILDEATSALDARTEHMVVNAIRDRGISCIVIAHRLSTVRDCDEIIVLDRGKVAERGTHDELMKLGGIYADLAANE